LLYLVYIGTLNTYEGTCSSSLMFLQHLEQKTFLNEIELENYSEMDKSTRTAACRSECNVQSVTEEEWDAK